MAVNCCSCFSAAASSLVAWLGQAPGKESLIASSKVKIVDVGEVKEVPAEATAIALASEPVPLNHFPGRKEDVTPKAPQSKSENHIASLNMDAVPETEEEMREMFRRKELKKLGGDPSKALYDAVMIGDTEIAANAIEYGADVAKHWGRHANTVLHMAASMINPGLLAVLAAAPNAPLNAKNRSGETALMRAVRANNKGGTQVLIDAGCDLEIQDNDGLTALGIAKVANKPEFIAYLQGVGAKDTTAAVAA
eukprot:CAMPEP_0206450468 /NCGR_PEP_ID=MMETSP0324_2-20121206/18739_1 /ASSEMBLY_ACC=CAM_ASM_000836 /TAXON_ID=2866 /ORGANISM="Crypthecodinium cohnii, Strain Seligo" /LENGTH=250 /DNA_ID=CAMNT_0053920115 /DNA_START=133 /DNA_END=885 /DNA_ORIENTATION=+